MMAAMRCFSSALSPPPNPVFSPSLLHSFPPSSSSSRNRKKKLPPRLDVTLLFAFPCDQASRKALVSNPTSSLLPSRSNSLGVAGQDRGIRLSSKAKASAEGDLLVREPETCGDSNEIGVVSVHHVGILCQNLEKSLDFYQKLLGLKINEARPDDKLPYRGAWLWVGSEMIHLMELPNPDPLTGRPEHGGRDRHTCIAIRDVSKLKTVFDNAGVKYTLSRSGRPAIFARDPDGNALEFTQVD